MTGFSRRNFLGLTGTAAIAAMSGRADAAMGPNDKFDLVIKGGDVLDPSQSLRGKRDILAHLAETAGDQRQPVGKLRLSVALRMTGAGRDTKTEARRHACYHLLARRAEFVQRAGGATQCQHSDILAHRR